VADRQERGVDRDFFFVSFDGFDTHSEVKLSLQEKFVELNEALAAFVSELKLLGVRDDSVILQTSDFGRTLTENTSGGTDHGWGGHYWLAGGSVNGRRIMGEYPSTLFPDGELSYDRGRFIPTTPWDPSFMRLPAGSVFKTKPISILCYPIDVNSAKCYLPVICSLRILLSTVEKSKNGANWASILTERHVAIRTETWTAGRWATGKSFYPGANCFDSGIADTVEKVCGIAETEAKDFSTCHATTDCETCTSTMKSDLSLRTCEWYLSTVGDNKSMSHCGLASWTSSGTKTCPSSNCESLSGFDTCVQAGCAWTHGACKLGACSGMDECYDTTTFANKNITSPTEICRQAATEQADHIGCLNVTNCETFLAVTLSGGASCRWAAG
jgi:Protein of unknown function (DUF1501)